MINVPCYGIHSDEVGIRYLVQNNGANNAHGFKDNADFNVSLLVKAPCPHNLAIVDHGLGIDEVHRLNLDIFAPVPTKIKVYRTDVDVEHLQYVGKINGDTALIVPQWAITDAMLLRYMYASNITCTIITGIDFSHSKLVKRILSSRASMNGKIVLHGNYLFPKDVPLLEHAGILMDSIVDPVTLGQQRMYNYLKETNG